MCHLVAGYAVDYNMQLKNFGRAKCIVCPNNLSVGLGQPPCRPFTFPRPWAVKLGRQRHCISYIVWRRTDHASTYELNDLWAPRHGRIMGLPLLLPFDTHHTSGRFVKQEQRERRGAKRKLMSGFKHRGASATVRGYHHSHGITPAPRKNLGDCIWKIIQSPAFLAGKWFAMLSIMRSWKHFNNGERRSNCLFISYSVFLVC